MTRTKSKMWSRFFKATLYSLLLIGAIGCVPTKRLTYLQEEEGSSKEYKLERNAYRVQPNDILSITIRTYDAETSQLFNIANMSQTRFKERFETSLNSTASSKILFLASTTH